QVRMQVAVKLVAVGGDDAFGAAAGLRFEDRAHANQVVAGPIGSAQRLLQEANHQVEVVLAQTLVHGDWSPRTIVHSKPLLWQLIEIDPDLRAELPRLVDRSRSLDVNGVDFTVEQVRKPRPQPRDAVATTVACRLRSRDFDELDVVQAETSVVQSALVSAQAHPSGDAASARVTLEIDLVECGQRQALPCEVLWVSNVGTGANQDRLPLVDPSEADQT